MPTNELLCTTKNGFKIYYDPIGSHASTHFHDSPSLKSLVTSLLEEAELIEDKEYIQHDFGYIIGKSDLIKTTDQDTILYAKRLNRDNYSRFIINKGPVDSSIVTIVLYKEGESYTLYSTYIGIKVPSFPTAPTATGDSIPFWKEHALAWGTQAIQPGTETKEWPW